MHKLVLRRGLVVTFVLLTFVLLTILYGPC